jgi:hypothetical protein
VHAAIEVTAFWTFAFLTICAAIVLLNIFCGLIESDIKLPSLSRETVISWLGWFSELGWR